MKLRQKFSTQISLLTTQIVIVGIIGWIFHITNYDTNAFIYVVIPMFILLALPTIYIHFNYYVKGKGIVYEIDSHGIIVSENEMSSKLNRKDFMEIRLFMTGTKIANIAVKKFPFEDYYFAKIILKDGKEIIISCLFSRKLDKILEDNFGDLPIIRISDFYPTIR